VKTSELWTCISCNHPECRREDFHFHLCISNFGHKLNENCRYNKTLCDFLDDEDKHYRGYMWEFFRENGETVVAHQDIKWVDN